MSIDVNVTNDLVIVTESSEDITVNVSNAQGPVGPAGQGVPVGGTTGQVLKKLSNTNYDTYWALDGGGVPYSGATGDVDLGEYELKAGQVEFDQSSTGTAGVAVMRWNDTDGTLDLGLKGGNVTLQLGQELVQRVVNKSGANLLESAYQVVKVTDAQGQRLAVDLAQGNNDANSTDTLGIVTETINNNQEGFITTSGIVRNINTTGSLQGETWADGDVLYLSPTIAGAITNIKPIAPNHTVVLGYVVYSHANNGKIFVKCENGYEIGELHDCYLPSPSNNDGIFWNTANSRYQNNTISGALGYTPVNPTRSIATTSPLTGGGDLSADRTLSIPAATTSVNGYLTSTDWNTFNNKQASLTLTTTGTSGAATLVGATLNIPQYSGGGGGTPGGSNTYVQYNDSGAFGGSAGFTYDDSTGLLTLRKDQNAATDFLVRNSTNSSGSLARVRVKSSGGGEGQFASTPSSLSVYGVIAGDMFGVYGNTGGGMFIANEIGNINFGLGSGNPTSKMILTNAGRLLLGTTSESTYLLDVNGTARVSGATTFNGAVNAIGGGGGAAIFIGNGEAIRGNATSGGSMYLDASRNLTGTIFVRATDLDLSGITNAITTSSLLLTGIGQTLRIANTGAIRGAAASNGALYIDASQNQTSGEINFRTGTINVTASGTINTQASAILTVDSTTKGFLPPRMTNAQRTSISSPAVGLIVYCTDATEGLYEYTSAGWVNLNGIVTNRQTASYTLALTDSNDLVEMNVASANNLTVPLNSSIAFPVGTKIDIAQYGAGQTTVVATSGVTIRSAGGALKLTSQYSGATLVKIATDEWYLFGNITT